MYAYFMINRSLTENNNDVPVLVKFVIPKIIACCLILKIEAAFDLYCVFPDDGYSRLNLKVKFTIV